MTLPRPFVVLLAVGIACAGLACHRGADGPPATPAEDTRILAQRLAGLRTIEARLTGFDEWRAWSGATALSEETKAVVLGSAAGIHGRMAASEDPEWYAALGVRHLLLGELSQSIALLESSRRMSGDPAPRLNDLAAACFAQASVTHIAEQLAYALDLAEAAARINPKLLAAQFNRALILESIGPPSRAADAWGEYLRADASSGWAREAKDRRDLLVTAAHQMAADPARKRASRQIVENRLLKWAQATAGGDQAGAAAALAAADTAATELRERDHTQYPSGLVADVRRHERLGRAKQFALAYVTGEEGRRLIGDSNKVAAGRFRLANAATLTSKGGAFSDYLAYWQLHARWFEQGPYGLEPLLLSLIAQTEGDGSDYIAARSRVLLGSVKQKLARYSDAIASYQRGIDGYVRIAEHDGAASSRMLLAAALREHGMWQEAWRNESMALADFDALTDDSARHGVLHEATRLALARRQTDLAARFQGFLAAHAREWKTAGAGPLTATAISAARIHLQRDQLPEAAAELARAEQTFSTIADKAFRESYRPELLTLQTEVQTRTAPALALQSAHTLLHASRDALYRRVRANWLLGEAAMAAGQKTDAAAAWLSGIAALENDNLSAREEQLRIARTSDVWAIYDELTRLFVDQQLPLKALEIAERGRARALLYALAQSPRPLPITARLGADATIVYYTLLRDRTLIWVIDGRTIEFRQQPGGLNMAAALSNELRAVAASQGDAKPVLQSLYRELISPIADKLAREKPVIIVPDGALSAVPFAALQSPDTLRLMIEDHQLQVAPSLTLLQHALDRRDRQATTLRVLAVGSPEASGGLPPLPGARREVQLINELYAQGEPLAGDRLSVATFLDAVRRSDVVHFAGHAVENRDYPGRSYLALPGSAQLTPAEIHASDFRHVRVLVLSACSTAEGAVERGEGVLSLARPFLAAGVQQVLATVTAVDDEVASLLVSFHKQLRDGATPAAALRTVQVDAYNREGRVSLRGWAAFELFGVASSR